MLDERAVGGHVGPGAARGRAPGAVGEQPRRQHDVVAVDAGLVGATWSRSKPRTAACRSSRPVHPASAELGVVAALVEDDAQHAGQQRRVLARAHLQVQVGRRRSSVRRGSITISFQPRFLASRIVTIGSTAVGPPGMPSIDTGTLRPSVSDTSAVENGWCPAAHWPWRSGTRILPGWSMVSDV